MLRGAAGAGSAASERGPRHSGTQEQGSSRTQHQTTCREPNNKTLVADKNTTSVSRTKTPLRHAPNSSSALGRKAQVPKHQRTSSFQAPTHIIVSIANTHHRLRNQSTARVPPTLVRKSVVRAGMPFGSGQGTLYPALSECFHHCGDSVHQHPQRITAAS